MAALKKQNNQKGSKDSFNETFNFKAEQCRHCVIDTKI